MVHDNIRPSLEGMKRLHSWLPVVANSTN
jgi:hypothetical protein